jgi:hypothetical protein
MIGFKNIITVLLLLAINIGCAGSKQMPMLKSGVENWNKWREKNTTVMPNLAGANLAEANLGGVNLGLANLTGANLAGTRLAKANFWAANLRGADLQGADLREANLQRASLTGANLAGAHLAEVKLEKADLTGADLRGANLAGADFGKVKSFYKAKLDTKILFEIKAEWPEKLATIWDDIKKDWVVDDTLLEQIKKRDWNGWPEEEDQSK